MALFFCPPFFASTDALPTSPSTSKLRVNVNALQGDQNVVEYWIQDARTTYSAAVNSAAQHQQLLFKYSSKPSLRLLCSIKELLDPTLIRTQYAPQDCPFEVANQRKIKNESPAVTSTPQMEPLR